jgi:transposase
LDLLADGDPNLEVFAGWAAKELVRRIYQQPDATAATDWIDQITRDFAERWMPPEVRRLGRTLRAWKSQIVAWHDARVSNGPTEAINNLIKRVKRVAFGFRRFDHYRIRALLYAGKPNWRVLGSIIVQ